MLPLPELKLYISPYIKKVDDAIQKIISENFINQIAKSVAFGGKRVRPTILILISNLLGGENEEAFINSAIAVELVHLASILHDDVVDGGEFRHGEKTAHTLLGNQQVILGGDFLFAESFKKIVETGKIEVIKVLSQVSSTLASGELEQLQTKITHQTSSKKYFEIIYKKTASLFEATTGIASIIQGKSSKEAFEFGKNIGMVFQIVDDIIDYTSKKTGKTEGGDFYEGKITLPVILASEDVLAKKRLEELFSKERKTEEDLRLVKQILESAKAIEKCKNEALFYSAKAREFVNEGTKEGRLILEIMEFFLSRTF
jgi:octaprenyl-diphosphate synthase